MTDVAKFMVVFYAEQKISPALDWLAEQPGKVQDKFRFLIELLEQYGSALHRPHAAPLERKIYELRARLGRTNYRLLYFFARRSAVLTHGCTKEAEVDKRDIDRAVVRRNDYLKNPTAHTYRS
jgi:hypothetical protein